MCWTRSWIWVCEPCVVVRRTSFHLETRFHIAWKYPQTFVLVHFKCLKRAIDNRPWPPVRLEVTLSKRELKQRQRRRQRERQKSNWFRLAKQQLCTYITPFCSFSCRRCTTTTWKCLISRFAEDVIMSTRQQRSFAFPELWYSPLESNSRQIRQHLTNLTRWNKRDEVWTSANKLYYWRFRSRRRCHCFKSS